MTITISAQGTQDLHVQDTFQVFVQLDLTIVSEDDWIGSLENTLTLDGVGLQYVSHEVVADPVPGEVDTLVAAGGGLVLTASEGWTGYESLPDLLVKFTVVATKSGSYTVYASSTSKSIWGEDVEIESSFIYVTVKRGHEPEVTVHVPGVLRTTCPICGIEILTDPQTWAGHMIHTHLSYVNWEQLSPGSIGLHACYGCGASFTSSEELLSHLYSRHGAVV